ncbi:hypothetical protein F7725_025248 [Dissostichus mawsoni]|uniref:Uncharacterized protein n=1 Tax=Dissostichus mawsoni TaxID=36200 RepID=A0A7J5XAL1_DISMA|nr:hypothetical protein F7725_025248 [Dissostichus mawsoni]
MDPKNPMGTTTPPPLLSGVSSGEREKEGGGGKNEEEDEKKRDREKEGAATAAPGPGGAGASGPGGAGGDQSHFSIKESSLSEGNVKLKIGLQAKRMKKPPKILENYVCRPAFKATVRHTGRGGGGARGNRAAATGDGAGVQNQSPSTPTPPPPAPPPTSTTTLSASQVNGSAPTKRGSPKTDGKSDTKPDTKAATTVSERPLNLHRPPSDSKTHPSGKKTPIPQPNPRTSSPSPSLPTSKEPSFEAVKPPQYNFSTENQRDKEKGVPNWGAPTVTEKLAQLIATCPPSKTPKPAKPTKIDPAPPLPSSGFMAPTAKQRDRAMANRNTYSRMLHLSPPPPVSRPPGRPYAEQRTLSAVSHLGSPVPSQGHHARESPALAEESSASEREQDSDSPRDLTNCPPATGTGKPEGKDRGPSNQSLRVEKSSSPSKRSPNRDSSRPGRTISPPEAVRHRASSSPEPDGDESPLTPLRDDSPDSSIDSSAEQDTNPLKNAGEGNPAGAV